MGKKFSRKILFVSRSFNLFQYFIPIVEAIVIMKSVDFLLRGNNLSIPTHRHTHMRAKNRCNHDNVHLWRILTRAKKCLCD